MRLLKSTRVQKRRQGEHRSRKLTWVKDWVWTLLRLGLLKEVGQTPGKSLLLVNRNLKKAKNIRARREVAVKAIHGILVKGSPLELHRFSSKTWSLSTLWWLLRSRARFRLMWNLN
jgi:hypothetical protein